jgi:hypothetical protein
VPAAPVVGDVVPVEVIPAAPPLVPATPTGFISMPIGAPVPAVPDGVTALSEHPAAALSAHASDKDQRRKDDRPALEDVIIEILLFHP